MAAALAVPAAQFKFPNQTFTVPDGFEVELAAGSSLVQRPITASFDDQGRLYVTDSSGSNDKPDKQLEEKPHRVLRLEDTDADGKFDRASVFADKMMFPEGCLWHDGSLYVAAPPSIWKLTDTDGDGVADQRVEWHQGKTLTGCANDLHGPYLGLDGWLYWCKGAFAQQSYDRPGRKPFVTRAAHIFRARPDHSGLEPVMTGGMDNPVGVAFTATGERILCGTFFVTHEPGHRDGLIHAIYGGVYGKINEVTDEHIQTGELMPIMTHMGPAAPCSVIRYESLAWGEPYRDNLFVCAFNLHKMTRHVLEPNGATYKTKDSDFLVSDNPDFHPTDVVEDADGSLLVIDTGGWYKICCPTSQLSKPDVLGAIYRVRRTGAPRVIDPRGLTIAWAKLETGELARLLGDARVLVQHRAVQELARRGDHAVPALKAVVTAAPGKKDPASEKRALWTLTRIASPLAQETVRLALRDPDSSVRCVALESASLLRDAKALPTTGPTPQAGMDPHEQRLYFEWLGRTGQGERVTSFVQSMTNRAALRPSTDRVLQHSLTYALIESADSKSARSLLGGSLETQPAALIALDQMDAGGFTASTVVPLLSSSDRDLRAAAVWVAERHPDWGGALAGFFEERLARPLQAPAEKAELKKQLARFAGNAPIQVLMAASLEKPSTPPPTRQLILDAMTAAGPRETPKAWPPAVEACLGEKDDAIVRSAVVAARVLAQGKTNAPDFSEPLTRISRDETRPADLRLEALAALPGGLHRVESSQFTFLGENLEPDKPVMTRSSAASVLARARLSEAQLLALADWLRRAGPLELGKLMPAFEQSTNATVGLKLIAALRESKALASLRPDLSTLAKYPPAVQEQSKALLALLNVDATNQSAHLDELIASFKDPDIRRGQLVFNSQKAACSSCHALGYLGGQVGPDLTSIGQVRTERDLLESIVYPSASFVRSYEPITVSTRSGDEFSGVVKNDAAEEVVLATGPGTEVRLARADIVEMRPGKVSLMPAGLDEQLTRQELADLVAFLKATRWGPR